MIALLLSLAWAADAVPEDVVGAPPGEEEAAEGPDRSTAPEVVPAEPLAHAEPLVYALSDGVEVVHVHVPQVRRVEVTIVLQRGSHEVVGGPTELAKATGWMLDVATEEYGAQELEILSDIHELEVRSGLWTHEGAVSVSVPRDDLELGIDIARQILRTPAIPTRDLKRYLRDQRVWWTVLAPSSQGTVASKALHWAWFPADHPYGRRPVLDNLKKMAPSDLRALHADWLEQSPVQVRVVGDVERADVEPLLAEALEGLGAPGDKAREIEVVEPTRQRMIAVDMPGQEQTAIRLRTLAPKEKDADRPAAEAMFWTLGGHFLSRLNANLREEKGYTYGVGAGYRNIETWGHWSVYVDVATENVAAAVGEIEAELARMIEGGVTDEELEASLRSQISSWNDTRQTAESTSNFYSSLQDEEWSVADARAQLDAAAAVTSEDVVEVAARYLGPDEPRVWVLAGDRSLLEEQIDELGWDVEWLDVDVAIQGAFPGPTPPGG